MSISETDLGDGKYTILNDNGILTALRYGEPWRKEDLVGDGLMLALVQQIEMLECVIHERNLRVKELTDMVNYLEVGNYPPNP
jgi:hypothetical protein